MARQRYGPDAPAARSSGVGPASSRGSPAEASSAAFSLALDGVIEEPVVGGGWFALAGSGPRLHATSSPAWSSPRYRPERACRPTRGTFRPTGKRGARRSRHGTTSRASRTGSAAEGLGRARGKCSWAAASPPRSSSSPTRVDADCCCRRTGRRPRHGAADCSGGAWPTRSSVAPRFRCWWRQSGSPATATTPSRIARHRRCRPESGCHTRSSLS